MFKDLDRNQAVISRAAKLNCLVLALWIVGCEPTAPGFHTLHPRSTADCTQHIDGSAYLLDPEQPEVSVSYAEANVDWRCARS